jgi:mannose-6-phosphate isomerase-like protein (cupin superfamily)
LADYTVKNIKELDNMAVQYGIDGLDARFARTPLGLRNFGFSVQSMTPNFRQPFGHHHGEQEEVYLVLRGDGRIKVDDDVVPLKEWDAIRVPANATRQLEAGAVGMDVLAMGAPHADDTEMLQGWWSD